MKFLFLLTSLWVGQNSYASCNNATIQTKSEKAAKFMYELSWGPIKKTTRVTFNHTFPAKINSGENKATVVMNLNGITANNESFEYSRFFDVVFLNDDADGCDVRSVVVTGEAG